MKTRSGDTWHCTNVVCHAAIQVHTDSDAEAVTPRCSCGAPMKKKYTSPVFRYLDFLRVEEPLLTSQGTRNDGKG